MSKNTKELMVVKPTIFDRIKSFFKILFSKNNKDSKKIEELNDDIQSKNDDNTSFTNNTNSNDFINNMKVEENTEEIRLIKLQNLIAEDVIKEEELPEEDIKALNKLYDKQILELKKSIEEYKEKIINLRMHINE